MNDSRERAGFNPELEREHQKDTDWVFGAASQICIALIPQADRLRYLPAGEVQRGRDDFMDCATRGPTNILEAKFTYLYQNGLISLEDRAWLENKGYVNVRPDVGHVIEFSDRFNAILSGTTANGNSMIAPIDSIHTHGLIPKKMLPASPDMSLSEYLDADAVTPAMGELGKQFLSRWPINYERVLRTDFPQAIEQDFINVAGFAWAIPRHDGVYLRVPKGIPNHVFVYFKNPRYNIFDNYFDSFDGDFVKTLAPDYDLVDYGYRLFIKHNDVVAPRSLVDQLLAALFRGDMKEVWRLIRT